MSLLDFIFRNIIATPLRPAHRHSKPRRPETSFNQRSER